MKKQYNVIRKTIVTSLMTCTLVTTAIAGNEDRVGSAGASELLINPWARSSAWADAGVASVTGLESIFTNVAGLAFTDKTEVKFNYTNWLGMSGININAAGIAQRISPSDVISVQVMSMGFGDLLVTTANVPEGGIGNFTPRYSNFNVGYAREFSNSIYGGINFKVINHSIADMRANGVAFDAGIRYVTGEQDQIKFGIALKNVGPTYSFQGDGLAITTEIQETEFLLATEQKSADYELPSLLNIGGSYDFNFSEISRLTVAAAFTANSFTRDQYRLGLDYGMTLKDATAFNVRAGYIFERKIFDPLQRQTALTGLTAGVSVDILVGENKSPIGIEYAYRHTNPFNGIHTIGATLNLK